MNTASETMNVALIGPYPTNPSLIEGGVQASVYGLARALRTDASIGKVHCFALLKKGAHAQKAKPARDGDVTYLSAPLGFLSSSVLHLPRVLRRIRALEKPVVHIHGTGLFQLLACAFLRGNTATVWTLHGLTAKEMEHRHYRKPTPISLTRWAFYTLLEIGLLKLAKTIIVDTPYVREQIVTDAEVHVIASGIFLREFAENATAERQEPLIVSIGVMDPRKGHHITLEAFAEIRHSLPRAKLVIAGALTDPAYLQELKTQAETLHIADSVEFAVNCPRAAILAMLRHARVFVLHSCEESQGTALCEALASGLPVVATRVGGIPYVVTQAEDGFLVEYGDINGYAASIMRLLTDNPLYSFMSRQALANGQRFDWSALMPHILAAYRQALHK